MPSEPQENWADVTVGVVVRTEEDFGNVGSYLGNGRGGKGRGRQFEEKNREENYLVLHVFF